MKRNGRLSLALHSLAHMASSPSRLLTSAEIARHVGTNPVVVRRVLGSLRQAGLLQSRKGHTGGWSLARSPASITLADVYLALDEPLIARDEAVDYQCSLERELHGKISSVLKSLEVGLLRELANIPISEISG